MKNIVIYIYFPDVHAHVNKEGAGIKSCISLAVLFCLSLMICMLGLFLFAYTINATPDIKDLITQVEDLTRENMILEEQVLLLTTTLQNKSLQVGSRTRTMDSEPDHVIRGIVYNLIFHWKGIIKFRFCEHQISSLAKNANWSLDTVIPL